MPKKTRPKKKPTPRHKPQARRRRRAPAPPPTVQGSKVLYLRVPDDLWWRINEAARSDDRSVQKTCERALVAAFPAASS